MSSLEKYWNDIITFPNLCSEVEHASIRVCAITDRLESSVGVLHTSSMKSGFFMKLTQNLSGKQFDFHACITSGSDIEWINADSSNKSKTHLTAARIQKNFYKYISSKNMFKKFIKLIDF